ncbi:MAG: ATP synthase F1 subunit delta [Saprospiraceae bacterium]
MSVLRIATRYAKSLLDLAVEQNMLEAVHADIQQLRTATQNRDLNLMLKSPILHSDKKNSVLKALFEGKVQGLTMSYLQLLVTKGREMYIPEIAEEFENQYKVLKNITTVKVTSAAPLSDEVLETLKKKLLESNATFKNLEIETKVNPGIIGGFIVEFDDKRYNASVLNKLHELKSAFNKNLYIKEF